MLAVPLYRSSSLVPNHSVTEPSSEAVSPELTRNIHDRVNSLSIINCRPTIEQNATYVDKSTREVI